LNALLPPLGSALLNALAASGQVRICMASLPPAVSLWTPREPSLPNMLRRRGFFSRPRSGHSLSASNDAVVLMLLKMDPWTLLDDHRQLELSDTLFSASRKRRRIDATCGDAMDAA
jgi:hypothetical protein